MTKLCSSYIPTWCGVCQPYNPPFFSFFLFPGRRTGIIIAEKGIQSMVGSKGIIGGNSHVTKASHRPTTSYFTSSSTSCNLISASNRSQSITRYLTSATTSNQEISDLDSLVVKRFEMRVGFALNCIREIIMTADWHLTLKENSDKEIILYLIECTL